MLNQPSNISPDEVNGFGCVDAGEDLTISWQVTGTSAMTAYQADICLNNSDSTRLYSTGKQTLGTPFWGTNYQGKTQYFSASIDKDDLAGAGIVNGGEYKIILTQWWDGNGTGKQTTISTARAAGNYNFAWQTGYINFHMPASFTGVIGYSAEKNVVFLLDNSGHFSTYTAEKSSTAVGTTLNGTAFSNGELWVTQSPESVFITRATPTLTLTTLPDPVPYRSYTFTASYEQTQGDAINWVRWELAESGDEDEPLYDSGEISGTGQLQMDYDGFFTGTRYVVRCTVETQNRIRVSTGWTDFEVYFPVTSTTGTVNACQPMNRACVSLTWAAVPEATGYAVYRRQGNSGRLTPVAKVADDTLTMWDYGVRSGETYTYYVFAEGSNVYTQEPMISNQISYNFWVWAILCARMEEDGAYHMTAGYGFKMGFGGVSVGSESNNNQPNVVKSFTKYPTLQTDNANYISGNVGGLINYTANAEVGYSDTAEQARSVAALSTTTDTLFLKDPKGNFRRIRTSAPVSNSIGYSSAVMPQTMTIPWVEVGDTDGVCVISVPGDEFFAGDNVVRTTLHIDLETGALVWTVPNNYSAGSDLTLVNGALVQSYDWTFTPADMTLNNNTGLVIAVI